MFEKHNIKDESVETGYGEWLKSDEDVDTRVATKKTWGLCLKKERN